MVMSPMRWQRSAHRTEEKDSSPYGIRFNLNSSNYCSLNCITCIWMHLSFSAKLVEKK